MITIGNPENCTGCLICEMVCSFHHTHKFSRSNSSIHVNKGIFSLEKRAEIKIFYEPDKGKPVCDVCIGEESALCVSFCPENLIKLERESEP
jgi:Fe-S-cluster-containing hydrogenase component 2